MASTGKTILMILGGLLSCGVLVVVLAIAIPILLWRGEVVRYQHPPTARLYDTYDLSPASLDPFRVGDAVARLTVHGHPHVSLGFLGKTQRSVKVIRARFEGVGDPVVVEIDEVVKIERPSKKSDLFSGGMRLKVGIDRDAFAELAKDGLKISVEVEAEGKAQTIEFQIERKVSQEVIWPT